MLVGFEGGQFHKAFHDPQANTLDLFASGAVQGGEAAAFGDALVLETDEEGTFVHLALDLSELTATARAPQRPEDAPRALTADVELREDAPPSALFDPAEGTLRLTFGDLQPRDWARLGDNLVWLAIDADAHLAALVVEGVSRDPGGRAQLAWLAEMGAE